MNRRFHCLQLLFLCLSLSPVYAQTTLPTDCNQNGTPDIEDLQNGMSDDCNSDGYPDECGFGFPPLIEMIAEVQSTETLFSFNLFDLAGDSNPELVITHNNSSFTVLRNLTSDDAVLENTYTVARRFSE